MAILDPTVGDGSIGAVPSNTPGEFQHAWWNLVSVAFPIVNASLATANADIDLNAQKLVNVASVDGVGLQSDPVGLNVSVVSGAVANPIPPTAYYNVVAGNGVLSGLTATTASNNVALGSLALPAATTANANVAIGHEALTSLTTGNNNVAIGTGALDFSATGDQNVVIGDHAGAAAPLDGKNQNVLIGALAGLAVASDANVVIGSHADTPNGAVAKQLNLANILMGDGNGFLGSGVLARVGGSGSLAAQAETFRVTQVTADSSPALGIENSGTNAAVSRIYVGTRDPSGLVSANAGSLYIRVSAAASALYINRSAANPGTSWSLVTAVP